MARPRDYFRAACGRVLVHAAKGRSVRHLDMIDGRGKVGLVSAMANVRRDGREEGVDRRLPLGRHQSLLRSVRGIELMWQAVDLIGFDTAIMERSTDAPLHLPAGFRMLP